MVPTQKQSSQAHFFVDIFQNISIFRDVDCVSVKLYLVKCRTWGRWYGTEKLIFQHQSSTPWGIRSNIQHTSNPFFALLEDIIFPQCHFPYMTYRPSNYLPSSLPLSHSLPPFFSLPFDWSLHGKAMKPEMGMAILFPGNICIRSQVLVLSASTTPSRERTHCALLLLAQVSVLHINFCPASPREALIFSKNNLILHWKWCDSY